MSTNQSEILERIKQSAKAITPDGSEILLFGFRARGTATEDSDWDILILLDKDGNASWDDYNNIGYPLNEIFWNLNQDVNTIIQTKSEWRQKSFTPFYKNVMQDAIKL